jgi:EthD domain
VTPLDPAIADPDQYHLHSECWFTDEAAYQAALESPEWAAVVEDSPKCFDNSSLIGAVLEERVMFEAGA